MLEKCEGVVPFLRKHGPKLKILQTGFIPGINVFDICINLEKFEVPAEKAGVRPAPGRRFRRQN